MDTCLPAGREYQISDMYCVYILYSEKFNRFYTGLTFNIENRLNEHYSGKTKSTKPFKPWKVIFFEECETRIKARLREKYYKSGVGREKLKKFLKTK